jgi:hypothetical protein
MLWLRLNYTRDCTPDGRIKVDVILWALHLFARCLADALKQISTKLRVRLAAGIAMNLISVMT